MKKKLLICLLLVSLLLTGCGGPDINDKDFLENYNYLLDNIWLNQDGSDVVMMMFTPGEGSGEDVLWGEIMVESNVTETIVATYEITDVKKHNKFVMHINEDWILTINQENGTVICEFEDGSEVEWTSISTKNDLLTEEETYTTEQENSFAGDINLGANYTHLTNNLWCIEGTNNNIVAFMPTGETTGILTAVACGYEVLESLPDNKILLRTKEATLDGSGEEGKAILNLEDRDFDMMYIEEVTGAYNDVVVGTNSFELATLDEEDAMLSGYEYATDNLWYWVEEGTTFYIQPIQNAGANRQCGIWGDIMFRYEIINADATEIIIDLSSMSSGEYKDTMSLEIDEDSEYLYTLDLISGEPLNFEMLALHDVVSFNEE